MSFAFLKKIPVAHIATTIERVAKFIQNMAILAVALFALLYFASPPKARYLLNYFNSDQAWFYVGLWGEDRTLSRLRFHAGRANSEIQHDSETGLIDTNLILFPHVEYLAENVKEGMLNRTIVGRSKPLSKTEEGKSEVWIVLKKGECIYVHSVRYGNDYKESGKNYKTIWALGNVLDCSRGY
jgi:hypothetical protein